MFTNFEFEDMGISVSEDMQDIFEYDCLMESFKNGVCESFDWFKIKGTLGNHNAFALKSKSEDITVCGVGIEVNVHFRIFECSKHNESVYFSIHSEVDISFLNFLPHDFELKKEFIDQCAKEIESCVERFAEAEIPPILKFARTFGSHQLSVSSSDIPYISETIYVSSYESDIFNYDTGKSLNVKNFLRHEITHEMGCD